MQKLVKKVISIAAILSVVLVGAPLSGAQASSYFSPSISVDKNSAKPGEVLTYTLKIKGTGFSDSVWTHLSFAGPLEYVPGTATATKGSNVASLGDSFIQDNKHRNLGVLKDGQTLTVSFKAKIKGNATDNAKTEVKANIQSRDKDNKVKQSQDCTAKATATVEQKDKEVKKFTAIKTVDKKVAKRGDTLTYTLEAKNVGTVTLNNFYIVDQLPKGVTLVPGSTRLTRNTTVTVTDDWIKDGLNTGTFAPGKTFTVTFKVMVNDDVANDTILENVGNFRSDELPDWVRCPVYTKVVVKTKPTPTPEQTPTPTPTPSPTGEVKGATPTPTPAPVTELPSTGPGAAVLASLGGIVSALMGRKYFISR